MTERVLPPPDKFASCPYSGNILEFYESQFECVYILLHPFYIDEIDDSGSPPPKGGLSKKELIEGSKPVSWKEVLELTNINSISEIDVGLRTGAGALLSHNSNINVYNILEELEDSKGIIQPDRGDIALLLENKIFSAIQSLGHKWLWVGDELGTERKLHWIDDLMVKDAIPSHGCVFTHDQNILVASHWDSHCSLLCSSKEIIDKILEIDSFEGFYCSLKTEVYWGLHEK